MRGWRVRWILWTILAAALAIRLAHWYAVRDQPFFADLIVDSKEYDEWAQQVASGDWLGSQVFFQAPLYPYLLAGIYAAIGRHLDAVYLLQILIAVAGIGALYRAGTVMGGRKVGLIAAALAAAYGPFVFYDVLVLKESLAVSVVCFLMLALAKARDSDGNKGWLLVGLLLGLLALLRENALLLVPLLLALAYRRASPRRIVVRRACALLIGVVLPLLPVAIRNGWVGDVFLPTTSNGGLNFYIGNNEAADGTYRPVAAGKQIPALERSESKRIAETALGRKLGPAEVSSYWFRKALRWAVSNPRACLRLQFRKLGMFWSWYEWPDAVDYYWTKAISPVFRIPLVEFSTISLLSVVGFWIVWRRGLLDAYSPAWGFATGWMLSTIAFFLFSRFRLPAVPGLILMSAVPIAALDEARLRGERRWWLGGLLVMGAFLLPYVPGPKARLDLVEVNLGRLADDRGDSAGAERHYRAALDADPKSFLASLNLGTFAARRQDWPAALEFFRRAVSLEPSSDDAECNLGGVLLATGSLVEAETHLDRALELNATNTFALLNKAVLLLRQGKPAQARVMNQRLLDLEPDNASALRMRERLAEALGDRPSSLVP